MEPGQEHESERRNKQNKASGAAAITQAEQATRAREASASIAQRAEQQLVPTQCKKTKAARRLAEKTIRHDVFKQRDKRPRTYNTEA